MNTKEYIESGILEQYIMGTLSAQEKQEVECMSHIYSEIADELVSIQTTMEAFAQSMSKTPPVELRNKILSSLHELAVVEKNTKEIKNDNPNFLTATKNTEEKIVEEKKDNIVSMPINMMRIAASILFLLSVGLGYLLLKNNKALTTQSNEISSIQKELASKQNVIAQQKSLLDVIENPDFQKIHLTGIPTKSPDSKAIVYWNKKSNDVYLNIDKLPEPSSDKQYQLWAIADGKPVDMGMVNENNIDTLFQKMKTISNASAFAITLEKKGGVPSPTMTEMYVMGGV